MSPRKSVSALFHSETVFASTGTFPAAADPTARATELRQRFADFRGSEILLRDPNCDPLHLAQALISRGFLAEAEEKIAAILKSGPECEAEIEAQVELARLRFYQGDWAATVAACAEAERRFPLQALNQMTVLQLSATALHELRDFPKSTAALRRLEAYATLFPYGQIPFYASLQRIKNAARLLGEDGGREFESREWTRWLKNLERANLDELHAWIRVKIDLERLAGRSHRDLALASVYLAHALGDETYLGLAWVDLAFALDVESRAKLRGRIDEASENQPRVRRLLAEIESGGEDGLSETARAIRAFPESGRRPLLACSPETAVAILLVDSGVFVDLKTRAIARKRLQPRSRQILELLGEGAIEKPAFFRKIWGISNFSYSRHDTVVRAALSRAREQSGIPLESEALRVRIAAGHSFLRA